MTLVFTHHRRSAFLELVATITIALVWSFPSSRTLASSGAPPTTDECPTRYESSSELWRNDLQQLVRCQSTKGLVNFVVMRMWNEQEANYFLDFVENDAGGVFNETELACGTERYCYMTFPKHFRLESHGGPHGAAPLRSPSREYLKNKKLHKSENEHATLCEAGVEEVAECAARDGGEEEKAGDGVEEHPADDEEREMRVKREKGYLLRHPMKGGVFFLPHPFNQMVVAKDAVNDQTAPIFAFIPKGNLHKLLNLWRNEDRIRLDSCQVVKGGLSIVRAVLAIDNTDEDDTRAPPRARQV